DAWLLIKERDEDAQPASEFDVVEALPDSVLAGTARSATRKTTKTAGKTTASGRRKSAAVVALPHGAFKAKLPLSLAPQLATLVEKAPADSDAWRYEIKFDGYRLLARINGRDVRLFTRQGHDWTP